MNQQESIANTAAIVTFLEATAARHHGQHEHADELLESLEGDRLLQGGMGALLLCAQSFAVNNAHAVHLLRGVGTIAAERATRDIDVVPRSYFEALNSLGTALMSATDSGEAIVVDYPHQERAADERRALSNAVLMCADAITSAHAAQHGGGIDVAHVLMATGCNAHDVYLSVGGTEPLPNFDNPASGPWVAREL